MWAAGSVLKEGALWTRVQELDYEVRKPVLKRMTEFLERPGLGAMCFKPPRWLDVPRSLRVQLRTTTA
jgi:hypothetical protein